MQLRGLFLEFLEGCQTLMRDLKRLRECRRSDRMARGGRGYWLMLTVGRWLRFGHRFCGLNDHFGRFRVRYGRFERGLLLRGDIVRAADRHDEARTFSL